MCEYPSIIIFGKLSHGGCWQRTSLPESVVQGRDYNEKSHKKAPYHLYCGRCLHRYSVISVAVRLASVCDTVRLHGANHPHIQCLPGYNSGGLWGLIRGRHRGLYPPV